MLLITKKDSDYMEKHIFSSTFMLALSSMILLQSLRLRKTGHRLKRSTQKQKAKKVWKQSRVQQKKGKQG